MLKVLSKLSSQVEISQKTNISDFGLFFLDFDDKGLYPTAMRNNESISRYVEIIYAFTKDVNDD